MSSSDLHVRRGQADYQAALAGLLPTGPAWPRDPDSVLMRVLFGLAGVWGLVDGRAADLLERESDPRLTIEMLSDWERAFGLPDPCSIETQTYQDRINALVTKMTMLGGQSRAFFIAVAAQLGYDIKIVEYSPYQTGIMRVGSTIDADHQYRWQLGPPSIRFYWTVQLFATRWSWFRAGSGMVGIDHMLNISLATDLECLIRRYKPAHTEVIFDYSTLSSNFGYWDDTFVWDESNWA
ncbi:hypothetical protein LMIY3S_03705 [Labrys miyagiensis]